MECTGRKNNGPRERPEERWEPNSRVADAAEIEGSRVESQEPEQSCVGPRHSPLSQVVGHWNHPSQSSHHGPHWLASAQVEHLSPAVGTEPRAQSGRIGKVDTVARPGKREEGGSDRRRETGTDRWDRRELGTKEKGRELQKEVVVLFDVTPDPWGRGAALPSLWRKSPSRPVISCLVGAGKGGQLASGW